MQCSLEGHLPGARNPLHFDYIALVRWNIVLLGPRIGLAAGSQDEQPKTVDRHTG